MSTYDFRHWVDHRPETAAVDITDDIIDRIAEDNPNLNKELVQEVIDAILSDPPGTVRVHPRKPVMAIRTPGLNPWAVVWFNGRGGGTGSYDYHNWPIVYSPKHDDD